MTTYYIPYVLCVNSGRSLTCNGITRWGTPIGEANGRYADEYEYRLRQSIIKYGEREARTGVDIREELLTSPPSGNGCFVTLTNADFTHLEKQLGEYEDATADDPGYVDVLSLYH